MQVRPYVIPTASSLSAIRRQQERAVINWAEEWGLQLEQVAVQSVSALLRGERPYPLSPDLLFHMGDKDWVACTVDVDCYRGLSAMLIGGPGATGQLHFRRESIVYDFVASAIKSLLENFLKSPLELITEKTKKTDLEKVMREQMDFTGSGIVCISLTFQDVNFHFYFRQQSLSLVFEDSVQSNTAAAKNKQKLFSMQDSILCEQAKGEVVLGGSWVDVGALSSLQIGDVINLDKSLNEPLTIRFGNSDVVCKGFMGEKDGNFAIQIDSIVKH